MKSRMLSASGDASIVYSAGVFGSYYTVVEALILNSVESHATRIDVQLDITSLSMTVIDNGLGIQMNDLECKVGELGISVNSRRNRCVVQSLAAINALSENIEIVSLRAFDPQAYKKVFSQASSQVLAADNFLEFDKHGTSVSVNGLFHKLSVRRQSLIVEKEITLIKEFIQNMSIIHHNIHWTVRDFRSGTCLLQLASSPSVMQRLITCYGMGFVTKLCQVSAAGTNMTLTGFISAPISSSCCWSKDIQYLYINERWVKGSTFVQQILNKVFGKLLLSKVFGMTSKHRNLRSDTSLRYPAFILQLTCSADMVDILPESDDQQIVVFRDFSAIQSLIEQLMRPLCQYNANLEEVINEVFSSDDNSRNLQSFLSPSAAKLAFSSPALDQASLEKQQRILQQQQSAQRTIAMDLFDSGFQLSYSQRLSLTPSTVPESPVMREGLSVRVCRPSPLPPFQEQFRHAFQQDKRYVGAIQEKKRSRQEFEEDANWLRDIFGSSSEKKQSSQLRHELEEQHALTPSVTAVHRKPTENTDSLSNMQLKPVADDETAAASINPHKNKQATPVEIFSQQAQVPSIDIEKGEEEAVIFDYEEAEVTHHSLHQLLSDSNNINPQPAPQSRSLDHLIKSKSSFIMHKKTMSVSKEAIHDMQVIGQVDKNYIAVLHHDKATTESTIMLFDQHAVDERLRYEKMYDVYKNESKRHTVLLPRPVSIPIDFVMLNTLQQRDQLFKWWCFDYLLQYDQESGLSQPVVVLLAVPCVYENEVLTQDDFLEFCHDIQMHHELPDHLQQPPSFLRIAASKACRSAIKFGQVLHMQEMQQMIYDLQSVKMPFQCAHGRPSCVPMLEMSELQRRLAEEEAASVQCTEESLDRFWEIYHEQKR